MDRHRFIAPLAEFVVTDKFTLLVWGGGGGGGGGEGAPFSHVSAFNIILIAFRMYISRN